MSESFALLDRGVQSVVFSSERVSRRKNSSVRKSGGEDRAWLDSVSEEIKTDLEKVHRRAREACSYKRKDLVADLTESMTGRLTTPDFVYSVQVGVSDSDPTEVRWSREVTFHGSEKEGSFATPSWLMVFGEDLDTVSVRFSKPLEIAEAIDRIEEKEPEGVHVDYDVLCQWCELSLEGVPATLRLEGSEMRVLRKPGTSLSLTEMLRLVNFRF